MKTSIKLVLIYFLMQLAGALVVGAMYAVYAYWATGTLENGQGKTWVVAPAMLLGFLFMTFYLWKKRYLTGDKRLYDPLTPSYLGWSLTAGAGCIFLVDALMSCLKFLPDWMESTFDVLQTGWLGILCLAVLGPVLEELLFRGAITKVLLRQYAPFKAILISGLIFGIFHLNPTQVVAASFSGFLFAWLYYKSGSLVPGILIHILNNSLSVWLSLNYKEVDTTADLMGAPAYAIALVVAVLLLGVALKKLNNMNPITTTER